MSWRDTAFVWVGRLTGLPSDALRRASGPEAQPLDWSSKVCYSGSWTASADPSAAEDPLSSASLSAGFHPDSSAPSPNAFDIEFKVSGQMSGEGRCFVELEYVSGSYLLDNGAGHQPYSDVKQTVTILRSLTNGLHAVAARGTTEFGPFVSLGYIDPRPAEGPVLTLARRYLEESDWRATFEGWGWYAVDLFASAPLEEWSEPGATGGRIARLLPADGRRPDANAIASPYPMIPRRVYKMERRDAENLIGCLDDEEKRQVARYIERLLAKRVGAVAGRPTKKQKSGIRKRKEDPA